MTLVNRGGIIGRHGQPVCLGSTICSLYRYRPLAPLPLVCLSGCLGLTSPCFGSCLVCTFGVPLPSDPLIVSTSTVLTPLYFPARSLPATTATTPTVYVSTLAQVPLL
jgi:hypothetical protein